VGVKDLRPRSGGRLYDALGVTSKQRPQPETLSGSIAVGERAVEIEKTGPTIAG